MQAFLVANATRLLASKVNVVLEPCCGRGNLVKPMRDAGMEVFGCDLHDYRDRDPEPGLTFGVDFLAVDPDDQPDPNRYDAVITNPPFAHALSVVRHAMDFAPLVVMLLRMSWLGGSKERTRFWKDHPCDSIQPLWPRPSFTGGTTDNSEYAWVVWQRRRVVSLSWPTHQILDWREYRRPWPHGL